MFKCEIDNLINVESKSKRFKDVQEKEYFKQRKKMNMNFHLCTQGHELQKTNVFMTHRNQIIKNLNDSFRTRVIN